MQVHSKVTCAEILKQLLAVRCELCGQEGNRQVHPVRKLANLKEILTGQVCGSLTQDPKSLMLQTIVLIRREVAWSLPQVQESEAAND
jgi:hypothetical protein